MIGITAGVVDVVVFVDVGVDCVVVVGGAVVWEVVVGGLVIMVAD